MYRGGVCDGSLNRFVCNAQPICSADFELYGATNTTKVGNNSENNSEPYWLGLWFFGGVDFMSFAKRTPHRNVQPCGEASRALA